MLNPPKAVWVVHVLGPAVASESPCAPTAAEARGGCSMVIEDIVMGFTDISANSEGGFSSIFVGDKVRVLSCERRLPGSKPALR